MAPTFSVDVLRTGKELEAIRNEWMRLLAASASNVPTLSPIWLLTWWSIFGHEGGRRLCTLALRDAGRLVALIPLLTRTHWYRPGIPFHRFEFLASGEEEADEIFSEYLGFIVERGLEEPVAQTVAALLGSGAIASCQEVVLPAMPGDCFMPQTLAGAMRQEGFDVSLTAMASAPYIPLPVTWEAYLAQLSSSQRYLVNRSLRDFDKWAGQDYKWRHVESLAELGQGKSVLRTLHQERWASEGQAGVFSSSRFEDFHDVIMPLLLDHGALELSWLEVRGEAIAAIYNIVWDEKVFFYQSGRKMDLPKGLRPGIVMHGHAIRRSIERKRREYDFLGGASQYKKQLALANRPLVTLRAVRNTLRETGRRHAEAWFKKAGELRRQVLARLVGGRSQSGNASPTEGSSAREQAREQAQEPGREAAGESTAKTVEIRKST